MRSPFSNAVSPFLSVTCIQYILLCNKHSMLKLNNLRYFCKIFLILQNVLSCIAIIPSLYVAGAERLSSAHS